MLLTGVLGANFGRVEARYPQVDLLGLSLRKVLNLTEDWLLSVVSEDDWNSHYKEILTASHEDAKRLEEQRERWGDPDEDGRGAFTLVREEAETPASNFNFGPAAQP